MIVNRGRNDVEVKVAQYCICFKDPLVVKFVLVVVRQLRANPYLRISLGTRRECVCIGSTSFVCVQVSYISLGTQRECKCVCIGSTSFVCVRVSYSLCSIYEYSEGTPPGGAGYLQYVLFYYFLVALLCAFICLSVCLSVDRAEHKCVAAVDRSNAQVCRCEEPLVCIFQTVRSTIPHLGPTCLIHHHCTTSFPSPCLFGVVVVVVLVILHSFFYFFRRDARTLVSSSGSTVVRFVVRKG